MSDLIHFYMSDDPGGNFLGVIGQTDEQLETNHQYIQWLFPLREPSKFNPDAPLLTEGYIELFRNNAFLQKRMKQAMARMLTFYGYAWKDCDIVEGENFDERAAVWMTAKNHNILRITRILKSLVICGHEPLAKLFFNALITTIMSKPTDISRGATVGWWARTLQTHFVAVYEYKNEGGDARREDIIFSSDSVEKSVVDAHAWWNNRHANMPSWFSVLLKLTVSETTIMTMPDDGDLPNCESFPFYEWEEGVVVRSV